METVVAAVVGGILAIAGGVIGAPRIQHQRDPRRRIARPRGDYSGSTSWVPNVVRLSR